MEVAIEVEDDLFFADLNRQISRLIMDDEDIHQGPAAYSPVPLQENFRRLNKLEDFSNGIQGRGEVPFGYENYIQTRESQGTGVFIPRSVEPRSHRHSRCPSHPIRSKRSLSYSSRFFHPIPHSLHSQRKLEVMASSFHQRL